MSLGLLFERFLSPERDGPPDIDVDIESDRREEVIQYVYERYGRHHTAQVANVITYRAALGGARHGQGPRLRARPAGRLVASRSTAGAAWRRPRRSPTARFPTPVLELALEVEDVAAPPRHPLRRHGDLRPAGDRGLPGRVGPDGQAARCCSGTRTTAPRTGLVKFDLLGLGMLVGAALRRRPRRASTAAYEIDLATIPQDDDVYDMLCRADTVGVFQIESRAQMATLPRLKPRTFYDLVVEVALIRPGPDPGRVGAPVHPAPQRPGAGHLPAPAARERRWARPSACRCSRSS